MLPLTTYLVLCGHLNARPIVVQVLQRPAVQLDRQIVIATRIPVIATLAFRHARVAALGERLFGDLLLLVALEQLQHVRDAPRRRHRLHCAGNDGRGHLVGAQTLGAVREARITDDLSAFADQHQRYGHVQALHDFDVADLHGRGGALLDDGTVVQGASVGDFADVAALRLRLTATFGERLGASIKLN